MESFSPDIVADTAAQLKQRIPLQPDGHYDFVFENDLPGRAALAVVWHARAQLTLYLVTDDPTDHNVLALQSGVLSVRNAPSIHLLSTTEVAHLATTSERMVWAVTDDRTSAATATALTQRSGAETCMPFATPFSTLGDWHPNQAVTVHELILRDIIREHARFLNFYGDRHNPQDLYERAKYPAWFTPPPKFTAAIPSVTYSTIAPDGSVLHSEKFTGVLQLASDHIQTGHRVQVELGSLLESLEDAAHDVTVQLGNDYDNPSGSGTLVIEVHYNDELYGSFDIATTAPALQVPIRAIRAGTGLTISIVALRDQPKQSWSQASNTAIRLTVHPPGTHPKPSMTSRATSWWKRMTQRRQRGN